jgi:hypothetical protein
LDNLEVQETLGMQDTGRYQQLCLSKLDLDVCVELLFFCNIFTSNDFSYDVMSGLIFPINQSVTNLPNMKVLKCKISTPMDITILVVCFEMLLTPSKVYTGMILHAMLIGFVSFLYYLSYDWTSNDKWKITWNWPNYLTTKYDINNYSFRW